MPSTFAWIIVFALLIAMVVINIHLLRNRNP